MLGFLVLDCIASGAAWIDMRRCGVDVLISAPQKTWSGDDDRCEKTLFFINFVQVKYVQAQLVAAW